MHKRRKTKMRRKVRSKYENGKEEEEERKGKV